MLINSQRKCQLLNVFTAKVPIYMEILWGNWSYRPGHMEFWSFGVTRVIRLSARACCDTAIDPTILNNLIVVLKEKHISHQDFLECFVHLTVLEVFQAGPDVSVFTVFFSVLSYSEFSGPLQPN